MGVVKLCDLMGTRYVINALSGAQRIALNTAASNGNTVDLAGCKFGPEGVHVLSEYYEIVDFQNSEDEYLDFIIKNNCMRSLEQIEEYEKVNLRNVTSIDTYMSLAQSLPQGAKIEPEVSLSRLHDKVTLVLLIMTRPDIDFDIRKCGTDIYDYVRDAWLLNAQHHSKYYELIPPDTVVREEDEAGYFGCPSYGFQREHSFIRNRLVLPWEFGNTKIISLDKGTGVEAEWRPVVEKCLDAFDQPSTTRQPGKVLRNLLTFRE